MGKSFGDYPECFERLALWNRMTNNQVVAYCELFVSALSLLSKEVSHLYDPLHATGMSLGFLHMLVKPVL